MVEVTNRFGRHFMIREVNDGCSDLHLGVFIGENHLEHEIEVFTDLSRVNIFIGRGDECVSVRHRFGSKNWVFKDIDGEESIGYSELIFKIINSVEK